MPRSYFIIWGIFSNTVEFYNFALYSLFISVLGATFFPLDHPVFSQWSGLITFSIGFLIAPFGAGFLGLIGDRYGRKQALKLAFLFISIPAFIIAFLPSYLSIGLIASVSVLGCRLLQGFSSGGEYNGIAIFTLEHLNIKRRGLFSSLVSCGAILGALLASLLAVYLTGPHMPLYAWRWAFACGGILAYVGFIIQKKLPETPCFQSPPLNKHLLPPIRTYYGQILIALIVGSMHGILSYIPLTFLNIYLCKVICLPLYDAVSLTATALLTCLILTPVSGLIFDKIKAYYALIGACSLVIILALPIFSLIVTETWNNLVLAEILLGLLLASFIGIENAILYPLFKASDRYASMSFWFCSGIAIFAPITPFILLVLTTKKPLIWVGPLYLISCALLAILLFFWKRSLFKESPESP